MSGGARSVLRTAGAFDLSLIALALLLRLVEYLRNKAIWLDEAHLAHSLIHRDYAGMLEPLDYGQGAPLAFLWIERCAVDLFGISEYALRFAPMLASLVSCVLAYALFRRMLPIGAARFAFAAFALSLPAIRYASEIKAYATDVLVALILVLALVPTDHARLRAAQVAALGALGAAAIWCAFPAFMVLGGIGAVYLAHAVFTRDRARIAASVTLLVVWGAGFAADYVVMLTHNASNDEVRAWWVDRFAPLPPTTLSEAVWYARTFFELFADPVGLPAAGLAALLFLLGSGALWQRDPFRLALLLAPLGVALLMSAAHMYPFTGRFLLFAAPMVLVVIGEGWTYLGEHVERRSIRVALAMLLFAQPAIGVVRGIVKPPEQGVRPAFQYLSEHWEQDDRVYVHHWASSLFHFYESKIGTSFPEIVGVSSRADWGYYVGELEPLRGTARVWFVFVNTPEPLVGQEEKFFVTYLDTIGRRVESQVFSQSSIYLYDLRTPATK